MSSAYELVQIFQRIDQRIDRGSETYHKAIKVINRRIEAEEKIAADLKQLLPEKYDQNDPLMSVYIDELRSEIEQHVALSKELKTSVYTHANIYCKTMMEKQKELHNQLKSQLNNLQKSILEREKAQKELENQKSKLVGLQGSAVDKQNKKIQKAAKDLDSKFKNENDVAMKTSSSFVPSIHDKFKEFDSTRLTKMKNAILGMANARAKYNLLMNKSIETLNMKVNKYDAEDRSQRYVAKVFDTSTKGEIKDDDSDLIVVAISDFRSEEPTDLQFSRGDKIHVLVQHKSGWWEGELNGKRGLFPETFIHKPNESHTQRESIGAVFLCIKDYKPTKGGDIQILSGDLVYVDFMLKGKCSGTNLRTKKEGLFPLDVLELRT